MSGEWVAADCALVRCCLALSGTDAFGISDNLQPNFLHVLPSVARCSGLAGMAGEDRCGSPNVDLRLVLAGWVGVDP